MPTFRFGQQATGNVYSRRPTPGNATTRRRSQVTANIPVSSLPGQTSTQMAPSQGSGGYNINRFNPAYDRLEEGSVVEDWIPRDLAGINKMFRIIYTRDPVCGPAIDIMSQLPWSDFDIQGVEDDYIRKFYEDAASVFGDRAQEMPAITTEYLVLGRFCASMIYDSSKGYWTDFVPHDSDFLQITPIPVRGFDPKIDLMLSPGVRQFVNSPDYRDVSAMEAIPEDLLGAMRAGRPIPLDPLSTLYLRRKTSPYDFVGCVTADTLVHTNRGVLPIAAVPQFFESVPHDRAVVGAKRCLRLTGCEVPGKSSIEQATHWVDKGVQPIARIETDRGYELKATLDHPVLVLNPDLSVEYKVLRDVRVGDHVAVNRASTQFSSSNRRLPVPDVVDEPKGRCLRHDLPDRMTPELARVLGYLVAEGSVGEKIQFANTDPDVMQDFITSYRVAFPDAGEREGDGRAIGSEASHSNRANQMQFFNICRKEIVAFLHGVGLPPGVAKDKVVPWSVMASTKECVAAFLSAYFEGDGSVRLDETTCGSASTQLVQQIQTLLLGFGIVACRKVHKDYVAGTGLRMDQYSTLHLYAKEHDAFIDHIGFRSPTKQARSQRRLERRTRTDLVPHLSSMTGTGDTWMEARRLTGDLQKVSPRAAERVADLVDDGLFWDEVVSHEDLPEEPVYDLVVPKTKSFTANGIVNHNTSLLSRILVYWALEKALINASVTAARRRASNILHITAGLEDKWEPTSEEMDDLAGLFIQADEDPVGAVVATRTGVDANEIRQGGDLWKWTDEWQTLSEGKMRGLGISEAIMNADSSYANMETARSIFTEQILQLRAHLTNEVYYKRLKILARAHGFRKQTKANLDHRIRIDKGRESPSLENLSQEEAMNIPEEDLITPNLHWRKSLLPEGDREYLDILQMIAEQGVPIPLKVWAARAGYDIDEAVDMLDEDIEMRSKIKQWKSKTGGGDEEQDAWGTTDTSEQFWDRGDQFMELRKSEARECLKSLAETVHKGKHEVLADTEYVERECYRILGNERKLELMKYVLLRLGLSRGAQVASSALEDIVDYFRTKPMDARLRHQELAFLAKLGVRKKDELDDLAGGMLRDRGFRSQFKASNTQVSSSPSLLSGVS